MTIMAARNLFNSVYPCKAFPSRWLAILSVDNACICHIFHKIPLIEFVYNNCNSAGRGCKSLSFSQHIQNALAPTEPFSNTFHLFHLFQILRCEFDRLAIHPAHHLDRYFIAKNGGGILE